MQRPLTVGSPPDTGANSSTPNASARIRGQPSTTSQSTTSSLAAFNQRAKTNKNKQVLHPTNSVPQVRPNRSNVQSPDAPGNSNNPSGRIVIKRADGPSRQAKSIQTTRKVQQLAARIGSGQSQKAGDKRPKSNSRPVQARVTSRQISNATNSSVALEGNNTPPARAPVAPNPPVAKPTTNLVSVEARPSPSTSDLQVRVDAEDAVQSGPTSSVESLVQGESYLNTIYNCSQIGLITNCCV